MTNQVRIVSYFSIPTDLAGEMRNWREFVSGEGYEVDLRDQETGETVTVRYFEREDDFDYVLVESSTPSELLDRVVGRAVRSLVMHSDNLMILR